MTVARDGGMSVPLPNGKDFWVFGDTPRYQFQTYYGRPCASAGSTRGCSWSLTQFIHGSSAGVLSFSSGSRPTAPVQEVAPGRTQSANALPTQFLPPPRTYIPDGSGRICNVANGGIDTGSVRWATGAVLLPDQTNIFIPYIEACVLNATNYTVQGWGFTEYNWKINKFDVGATDVYAPARNGAAISASRFMGSPVVANNTVTLFSATCCSPGGVYSATVAADVTAFRKPGSYALNLVAGVPATYLLSVAPPSDAQPLFTMYWVNGPRGRYYIYTATNPSGPWSKQATGTLPRCAASPAPCTTAFLHPELSTASQLLVSYYLPAYGPGIATHPYPRSPLDHLVWASLPSHNL